MDNSVIRIMVNGIPDRKANTVFRTFLEHIRIDGLSVSLIHSSLVGSYLPGEISYCGVSVQLIPPNKHEEHLKELWIESRLPDVAFDFNNPKILEYLASIYCDFSIPFIAGFVSQNAILREKLIEKVENSSICALITRDQEQDFVFFLKYIWGKTKASCRGQLFTLPL